MRFTPRVTELCPDFGTGGLDPGEILSRLRHLRGLVALDSAGGEPRRWSVIGFEPLRGIALPSSIAELRAFIGALRRAGGDAVPGPFAGGFLGALSYDLGVANERPIAVAPDPWHSPPVAGGLYTDFVVRDEETGRLALVLGEDPGDARPPLAERRRKIEDLLRTAHPGETTPHATGSLVRETAPLVHRARIESLRASIAAGDFYQANLAHRSTRAIAGDPIDLYRRLRRVNPAPYAAYLAWDRELAGGGELAHSSPFGNGALLSASPELLLEFDGRTARTRPIKGTAPRGRTPAQDREQAARLLVSAKDQAELAMIVDLERNDLGRIAVPGSVRVEGFPRLETYASVHHLTADVVAHPHPSCDAVDVLAALFPGGSVTGAPKLASMHGIAREEGHGRGFFSGSLGFLALDGRACFNILIRTLVWRPLGRPGEGEVSFHVGGGITWSSDPAAEERETCFKAEALAAALEGEPHRALARGVQQP